MVTVVKLKLCPKCGSGIISDDMPCPAPECWTPESVRRVPEGFVRTTLHVPHATTTGAKVAKAHVWSRLPVLQEQIATDSPEQPED